MLQKKAPGKFDAPAKSFGYIEESYMLINFRTELNRIKFRNYR